MTRQAIYPSKCPAGLDWPASIRKDLQLYTCLCGDMCMSVHISPHMSVSMSTRMSIPQIYQGTQARPSRGNGAAINGDEPCGRNSPPRTPSISRLYHGARRPWAGKPNHKVDENAAIRNHRCGFPHYDTKSPRQTEANILPQIFPCSRFPG